jgi:DNA-binding response OmpR family regulator
MSHHILICGNDDALLRTRGLVLSHSGFTIACACTAAAFNSIPETPPIDLAIVGHDLSSEQQGQVAEDVWERWPDAKILYLNANNGRMEKKSSSEFVSTSAHPPVLIEACRQILSD